MCHAGSGKGSARATLTVLRAHCTAARVAALFGREKARSGAVCVSRSRARLALRPWAQATNAGGRRKGVGVSGAGESQSPAALWIPFRPPR